MFYSVFKSNIKFRQTDQHTFGPTDLTQSNHDISRGHIRPVHKHRTQVTVLNRTFVSTVFKLHHQETSIYLSVEQKRIIWIGTQFITCSNSKDILTFNLSFHKPVKSGINAGTEKLFVPPHLTKP